MSTHDTKTYGEEQAHLHIFFTSALDENGQLQDLVVLRRGDVPGTHKIGDLLVPTGGQNTLEKVLVSYFLLGVKF